MPAEDVLSDNYVASLLVKDAKTSNARYSTYGLQELLPQRSTYNAPKPNTRFLKSIIQETDNHNAALRAKELVQSGARLRNLRDGARTPSGPQLERGRLRRGDDHRTKRRRMESNSLERIGRMNHHRADYSQKDTVESSRRHRKHHNDSYSSDEDKPRRSRPDKRGHRHRSHRGYDRGRSIDDHRQSKDRRKRSQSSRQSRSHSPQPESRRHRHQSHHSSKSKSLISLEEEDRYSAERKSNGNQRSLSPEIGDSVERRERSRSSASDSDPLEAIIGPPPAPPPPKVHARGRGTFASTSAMDSHFSSNYDPSIDVQPDVEVDDDWDMALEALRDRQKWQKQGAERLKSAGFTEEEVEKWEKGGEKREENVRWKGRGEGREWDRGKVVGHDGVETKPEWGRLKGT